jgi:TonB family protein
MRLCRAFAALFVPFAVSGVTAQELPELKASTYVPAEPLQRQNPSYPPSALSESKEGWVLVSYVISPTGDVTEPMIEDSSGVEEFERAALRAVGNWKYRPATEDGESVEQAMTKTMLRFQLRDNVDGASQGFISK